MKVIFPFCLILMFSFSSFAQINNNLLPKVWMTYYDGSSLEEDFTDMKNHGVDAVEVGIWGVEGNSKASEVLKVARKTNMKLIIGLPEVSEEAYNITDDKTERAVMMGGAYNGKAIDRFRFAFTPEKHIITIESPLYDSTNCYGDIGRYFMGLKPVNAEVVVKLADYDGTQHLKIIKAKITPQKENFWNMEFDLTGVKGDLGNVVLAVYWTSEGTRDYWIFGDAVSMFSEGFSNQLQTEIKKIVSAWKTANNGVFPSEIIAVRYGDECFHISGHLNSDDCSYPMWDYSESAKTRFQETSNEEFPRGVGWTDMFGHQANARWMYNFHEVAANSVKLVKECLKEEGVGSLPVFRNITRMNVFDVMNDFDGSGLELLAKELDILHIDPYPVSDKGYNKKIIPRDMTYLEGLARRFNKPVVPWMQAHVYGSLKHPTPEHIAEMMKQQKQFNISSVMWLGYGFNNSGNTFPKKNAESWQQAKTEHALFKDGKIPINKPDFAVIRPYTVRSLRGSKQNSADRFLTDVLLEKAVFRYNLQYDPFEPFDCSDLDSGELNNYPFIISEIGIISNLTLKPFLNIRKPVILIIADAEFKKTSLNICGIKQIENNQNSVIINEDFKIVLDNNIEILYQINNRPVLWRKDNIIFVGHLPENNLNDLATILLEEIFGQK